jgi:enediyne biosynthesis protein E4
VIRSTATTLSAALLLLACGADESTNGTGPSSGSGGGGGAHVAPVCDLNETTGKGFRFVDRSEAWGLTSAQIVGNRIVSGDLDGDGYPDLIVHAIGTNNRETIGGDAHLLYVLMNEPNESGGRRFVDRTAESGYGKAPDGSTTQYRSAQLAVLADVDNDGDLDIFSGVYTDQSKVQSPPIPADLDRSQILVNDGKGRFTAKESSGLSPYAVPTTGASFVDADRDGKLDLFLGYFQSPYAVLAPQLLRGAGDGTFEDISFASGVTEQAARRTAYGVTTCDLDGDGAPELLVSAYARGPNVLFKNDGSLHYGDVGEASGYATDELTDYRDNEFFKCYCTLHATATDCAGVASPSVLCPDPADSYWSPTYDTTPARLGGNTFTTVCSDVDGDGKLDLYNAEIAHWWAGESSDKSQLLVNSSDETGIRFVRKAPDESGMIWEHPTVDWNEGGIMAAAMDVDNDGREDVVVGASDYPDQFGLLFHQKADGTFEEIGELAGFHHACVSGLTIADFDRDGDLDIVVGSGTARDCSEIWDANEVHLYENDANQNGHFLLVKLRGDGTTTNRSGIGARVVVEASGKKLTRELGGGYGHMGMQNDTVLFFGLGGCGEVNAVTVTWPNGERTTQTFENVVTNRLVELRQGDPNVYEALP